MGFAGSDMEVEQATKVKLSNLKKKAKDAYARTEGNQKVPKSRLRYYQDAAMIEKNVVKFMSSKQFENAFYCLHLYLNVALPPNRLSRCDKYPERAKDVLKALTALEGRMSECRKAIKVNVRASMEKAAVAAAEAENGAVAPTLGESQIVEENATPSTSLSTMSLADRFAALKAKTYAKENGAADDESSSTGVVTGAVVVVPPPAAHETPQPTAPPAYVPPGAPAALPEKVPAKSTFTDDQKSAAFAALGWGGLAPKREAVPPRRPDTKKGYCSKQLVSHG